MERKRWTAYNVISHNVMIAFLCEKLHRKASHVSDSVGTTLFASRSAEAKQNGSLLANSIEEFGACQGRDVVGDFKFTPSTRSFSMDNSSELSVHHALWRTEKHWLTSLEYAHD